MNEKIKSALKTAYPNMGFSDEVFDGVASLASITVKEEAQIEDFVKNANESLKSFQSNVDKRVGKIQIERDQLKQELDSKQKPPTTQHNEGSEPDKDMPEWAKKLQEKIEGFETKQTQAQQLQSQAEIKQQARQKLIEKGIKESSCDEILDAVQISEGETVDSLVEKGVEKNNKWQSLYTPEAGNVQSPSVDADADSAVKDFFAKKAAEKEQFKN